MAKKKQELSPEERLAAALVPEEEQPYQLPEGWKWVYLGKMCQFIGGGTPSKSRSDYWNGDVPWASIKDVKGDYLSQTIDTITESGVENSATNICPRGSLIVATRIEPGKTIIANIDTAINQDLKYIQSDINVKFLHRYFQASKQYFINKSSGSTVLGIKLKVLQESLLPLPSQSEQQRIVARIESLFAKLDAAKEKVQSVLDAHEARKAALLHDAFTGKLTAKWRTEQGIDENVYRRVPLAEVCNSIFDGDHMPPPKSSSGIPFLVISNVNTGKVNFSDTRFVPQDYYDALTDTRKPQNGDVLYTLVGTYGIPVLVDTDQAFCFQRHMALLKPREDTVLQKYLWYALQEKNFYREATKIAKGTAQLTVPIKGLRQLTIPMASLLEQQEIVRILDRLLGREETVRQSAESVLESIDRMKQSILARAFRGEL